MPKQKLQKLNKEAGNLASDGFSDYSASRHVSFRHRDTLLAGRAANITRGYKTSPHINSSCGLHGSRWTVLLRLTEDRRFCALHHGGILRRDGLVGQLAGNTKNVTVFYCLPFLPPRLLLTHFQKESKQTCDLMIF